MVILKGNKGLGKFPYWGQWWERVSFLGTKAWEPVLLIFGLGSSHTLITITWYAGIMLGNDLLLWPTYNLTFVICFIVSFTHHSHAHHSFVICTYLCIITESFPVTTTNHTSQSLVVYICVVSNWELPSFDILGFPLPLLPCRLRTSLENSRRTPSTNLLSFTPLSSILTSP